MTAKEATRLDGRKAALADLEVEKDTAPRELEALESQDKQAARGLRYLDRHPVRICNQGSFILKIYNQQKNQGDRNAFRFPKNLSDKAIHG